jgi:hypothetical protein
MLKPRCVTSLHNNPRFARDVRMATKQAFDPSSAMDNIQLAAELEMIALRSRIDDQAAELVSLNSELQTLQSNQNKEMSPRADSRIGLKARLNAAVSQSAQ